MRKVLIFSLVVVISATVFGGNLDPSAAPGPTMKTLDDVEARMPIPGSDVAVGQLFIYESGSYYLTGDRVCSGNGLVIIVDNVTIDLNGFSLVGPDTGTNYGVYMDSRKNVEIRNGTIRDFEYGVYENGFFARNLRVINVRSVSNTLHGIYSSGKSSLVKDCTVSDNGDSPSTTDVYGIYVSYASTVTGNTVDNNGSSAGNVYGIYTLSGSTVTDNMVYDNGDSATNGDVYGIYTGSGSTVTGNTSYDNGSSVTSAGGKIYGIFAGTSNTVSGNTSQNNGGFSSAAYVYGIQAGSGSTVTGNTSYDNGHSAGSNVMGIAVGSGSTFIGNTSHYNGFSATGDNVYGIYGGTGLTITGNSIVNNGANASGDVYGMLFG